MQDRRHRPSPVPMTRRDFLAAGVAMGSVIAVPALAAEGDPVIEFARASCGTDVGRPRILVGYASTCGSTGEIAAAIGKKLCAANARTDVRHLTDVTDLDGYDAFVIGSAIHGGMWMPEAMKFLRERRGTLAKAPVAYFISCIALAEDKDDTRKLAQGYVERPLKLVPQIRPVAFGKFAGKVDYANMPKRYQPVMRRIVPSDTDARNWDAIGQWGEQIAPRLTKR
jgi:menaquinone-dependent protoporphyrinogen oxidase